ncbi:hypothetical protein LTR36_005605 [Oleoguttula mirabilis]|uniref:Uncharacterized protein n=1 Tax=Oleoguttula mirabilis TaxID=1507867 RepID=A0AAV9JE28_9PEZI|nr:hypothetical protein LTR36_005605 [Oleoguttula mirabilis]
MAKSVIRAFIALQVVLFALLFIAPLGDAAFDVSDRSNPADASQAFTLCNADCKKTKGGLPSYMQCPPYFDTNGRPVKLPKQTGLAELSERRSEIDVAIFEPAKRDDPSRVDTIFDAGNARPAAVPPFHEPGVIPPPSLMTVSTGHLPPTSLTSRSVISTATIAAASAPVTISGPIWSGILLSTTFMTETITAAEDMASGLDKRQIIGEIPWRHDTTTKSKKPKPIYTHHSDAVSATIGFCGTPGSSCNEKVALEDFDSSDAITTAGIGEETPTAAAVASATANSMLAAATSVPAIEVRDAAYVPSLVRICNVTDLVDCYYPLAPGLADDGKDIPASSSTSIPWAPTTLATYAPNTWNGAPPTTLSTYAGNTFAGQPPPRSALTVSPQVGTARFGAGSADWRRQAMALREVSQWL